MPYKRNNFRSYKKKQYQRKRRFTKMDRVRKLAGTQPETAIQTIARGVGDVATIARTVGSIMTMINVEDKFVDTSLNGAVFNTGAYSINLNGIATGTGRDQRNGLKILDQSIQLKLAVSMDPAQANGFSITRMVLVMDKKPQIGNTLFQNVYSTNSVFGLINKDKAGDRYVILKDWKIILNASDKRTAYKDYFVKLDRIHTQYTAGGATDFETGALYLLAITDSGVYTNSVNGNARFIFSDN